MPVDLILAADHSRKRSLGWLGVRWIEHFVIHGPGDIQGTSMNVAVPGAIPLSDELAALTVDVYALDANGHRLYDSAFYSRPKGADKSGMAGRLGLFEAMGPCRFAGWADGGEVYEQMDFRYVYERGEPMGRMMTYPFLRILATEEEQAGNVYDTIHFNLLDGPLRESFRRKDDVGLTRVFLPDGGEIRPSTASNAAKDGGLETWVSFDETHLYTSPELRRMHATVRRNLTKRMEAEPWSFEASTMYAPGEDSIAERSHERANLIRDGKLRVPRAYFNHRQAPEDLDLTNEAELRAGLKEAYGDAASYTDFDRKVAEIYDPVNDVDDSMRYYLNRVTAHSQAWVTAKQWDDLARLEITVENGALVTLGLHGSPIKGDVALIASEVESGHMIALNIWTPQRDEEIDREAVDAAVEAAFKRFDVVGFYADRQFWTSEIARWEQLHSATLCVQSTRRHPIQWDTVGHKVEDESDGIDGPRVVVKSAEDFHAAIVDAQLTHDGSKAFRAHMLNTRRKFRPGIGVVFGKEAPGSSKQVNAAWAAMLARQCRQDYLALPEPRKRKSTRSVYEGRGVRRV